VFDRVSVISEIRALEKPHINAKIGR
jgi:hypothetical protein